MTCPTAQPPRRILCAKCGTSFECCLAGVCWCNSEPYRLPVPVEGAEDCLCAACLRAAAARYD